MVHNPCGFSWENQYLNAESWFNEMGYNTEAVEWPTKAKIQSHIQSNELKRFYEIAHGTSLSFGGGCRGTDNRCYPDLSARPGGMPGGWHTSAS